MVCNPILGPILIHIAYVVHTHKQFKVIVFYSAAIKTFGKQDIYVSWYGIPTNIDKKTPVLESFLKKDN